MNKQPDLSEASRANAKTETWIISAALNACFRQINLCEKRQEKFTTLRWDPSLSCIILSRLRKFDTENHVRVRRKMASDFEKKARRIPRKNCSFKKLEAPWDVIQESLSRVCRLMFACIAKSMEREFQMSEMKIKYALCYWELSTSCSTFVWSDPSHDYRITKDKY